MDRRTNRWPIAIFLGLAVALVQCILFASTVYFAWSDLSVGSKTGISAPMPFFARIVNHQLVFPVAKFVWPFSGFGACELIRAVDLSTGASRDFPTPGMPLSYPMSMLSHGQSLWYVIGEKVLRFEGAEVTSIVSKNTPSGTAQMSDLFLHQGKPALIFLDQQGQYRLSVFEYADEEGYWVTGQRVVLPGPNRVWKTDELTGESNLVSMLEPNSLVGSSLFCRVHILQAEGEIHLLQSDMRGPAGADQKTVSCYRKGLVFIDEANDQSTTSALAPENLLPDGTGWTLLDSEISIDLPAGSLCAIDGQILLTSGRDIWHQVKGGSESAPARFEVLRKVDEDKIGDIAIVQDPESKAVYVISNILKEAVDLYRLDGDELHRVPIRIEGMASGALRWLGKQMLLGLSVIALGMLGVVLLANFWCDHLTYSFGHDTVILASLLRRSVARILDLGFSLGPLIGYAIWMFADQFHLSFYELLSNNRLATFQSLVPFVQWVVVYWCCSTLTTGLWGVTPGKWTCRIRVVRSTLRRCGFPSALLRELLLWIDAPQYLTVIPGVVCLIGTQGRARIGDLIAGTVVVMHRNHKLRSDASAIVQDDV